MLVLTEPDLRQIVRLDDSVVACVEDAFAALATKAVVMPPILRLDIAEHRGEVDVKTAYVPGLDGFAIKVSPGFFDNPKLGLPSLNGLMVLLSATTGLVEALLLDNGYLTDVRTAAAGAVAARHLSKPDARHGGDLRVPASRRGCSSRLSRSCGRSSRRGSGRAIRPRPARRRATDRSPRHCRRGRIDARNGLRWGRHHRHHDAGRTTRS